MAYSGKVVTQGGCLLMGVVWLPREDQQAAITLVVYSNGRSKNYGRYLPNKTLVYSNRPVANKRKIKHIDTIELL